MRPVEKFLVKDEEILWRLEDTFTVDRKKTIFEFFLFYLLVVVLIYFVFYIQFIMFESVSFQEILFRNLYFLIFISLFSIFVYLIRRKFPVYINSEYFLTNFRFIYLRYSGVYLYGFEVFYLSSYLERYRGYKLTSSYYPDITSVEVVKNIQDDIFEVKISKNVKKGLLFTKIEVVEEGALLDKKGLEILKQKIKK
jgi:hypothetical protein